MEWRRVALFDWHGYRKMQAYHNKPRPVAHGSAQAAAGTERDHGVGEWQQLVIGVALKVLDATCCSRSSTRATWDGRACCAASTTLGGAPYLRHRAASTARSSACCVDVLPSGYSSLVRMRCCKATADLCIPCNSDDTLGGTLPPPDAASRAPSLGIGGCGVKTSPLYVQRRFGPGCSGPVTCCARVTTGTSSRAWL